MNPEKESLQAAVSAGNYRAPKVKIVKVNALKVMCTSPNGYTPALMNDDSTYEF